MTALSAERRRYVRGARPTPGEAEAAASQNIYRGAHLGANAAGAAVPMSDATAVRYLGVASATYLSTTAGQKVGYEYGHEEWFPIVSGTITAANIGFGAAIADDSGVTDAATAAFDRIAGRITGLETKGGTAGVWIHIRQGMEASPVAAAATPAGSGPYVLGNIPIGATALGSTGTSAVHVGGSIYVAEIYVPEARRVTGIGVLNGGTVGTDNILVGLYNAAGVRLANSDLAGVLSAGANAFQEVALTAALDIAPGRYFIAVQCNGTTATTRRIAASTYRNRASITAGTFGTLAAITPPTTITADAGPIGYLY